MMHIFFVPFYERARLFRFFTVFYKSEVTLVESTAPPPPLHLLTNKFVCLLLCMAVPVCVYKGSVRSVCVCVCVRFIASHCIVKGKLL